MAYIWIALVAVPVALLHLRAFDRFGARKTRTSLFFIITILLLLFVPAADASHRTVMTILFVIIPTAFAALFSGAWLLAGDLLEGSPQSFLHTVYSRIGASSMIGGILGGFIAKIISHYGEPRFLIGGGALILLLVGLLVSKAHRKYPIKKVTTDSVEKDKQESTAESFSAKQSVVMKQRYVVILVGISVLTTLAAIFIEFQFYAAATVSENNNAQFFENFYIIINAASLILQLFVAPRLQAKLGIAGALLLLPIILLGSLGVCIAWAVIQARIVLKITEGEFKSSIHRSTWEQVYLPIERQYRDVAKTVIDGTVARIAEGAGSGVLLIWLATTTSSIKKPKLKLDWLSNFGGASVVDRTYQIPFKIGLLRYRGG